MNVTEIAPGLWRWTAWHEEWKQEVGSLYWESSDAVVVIDPLVPADDAEFWRALDRDLLARPQCRRGRSTPRGPPLGAEPRARGHRQANARGDGRLQTRRSAPG